MKLPLLPFLFLLILYTFDLSPSFFLGIAILQFFPKFSTISPGLVIFPLLVVVTITAVKDAYEDVKRHQSDYRVNHSSVRVLSGGDWVNPNVMQRKSKTFVPGALRKYGHGVKKRKGGDPKEEALVGFTGPEYDEEIVQEEQGYLPDPTNREDVNRPHWTRQAWENTAVGDFVKVLDNESIPADLLICSTSEDENVAYVETKNLDGETSLKSRNAVPSLTHLRTAADCANSRNAFSIECDRPEVNMYRLNAAITIGKETFPVDMQMAMLRGSVLKNTKWIIGIVIYTGEDTKIVMNSGGTPSKRSKVERQMNPQVYVFYLFFPLILSGLWKLLLRFVNLILLALMATACGIIDSVLEHRDYPAAPWLYGDNIPGNNPSINGLVTFFFALITYVASYLFAIDLV
jgi:phospholipid-translocating ATPase